MKCNQITELFDSYLKKTATSQEVQALETHIKTCESCRKQLELYRLYFADVKIEDDFPVPSQLNAKIKYAIQQARETKETKKIPFWQNKRILSAATACAFLFVASVLGVANYDKLQNAAKTPVTVETPVPAVIEKTVNITSDIPKQTPEAVPTPATVKESRQIPQASVTDEPVTPQMAEAYVLPDTSGEIQAYSGGSAVNTAADAATEITEKEEITEITGEVEPFIMQRNIKVAEDITLSSDWKDKILEAFPHEVISEEVFLVTITKAELETLLEFPLDADETKTQLTIRFTTLDE